MMHAFRPCLRDVLPLLGVILCPVLSLLSSAAPHPISCIRAQIDPVSCGVTV